MVAASDHNPQQIPLLEKFVNAAQEEGGFEGEGTQTNQDI